MHLDGLVIGYVHPGVVEGKFASSLTSLLLDDARDGRILKRGGIIELCSGPRVAEARSQVVDEYLKAFPNSPWLLFIDSDMTFSPDAVRTLMAAAHPINAPIVGGLCFAGSLEGRIRPVMFRLTSSNGEMEEIEHYEPNTLMQVGATGAAFLLVHRNVWLTLSARFRKIPGTDVESPYPWFVEGMVNAQGAPYGEDVAFCLRANACGIPVHVHTGAKIGHVKPVVLDEALWMREQERRGVGSGAHLS